MEGQAGLAVVEYQTLLRALHFREGVEVDQTF
jgi:hypothetical protein